MLISNLSSLSALYHLIQREMLESILLYAVSSTSSAIVLDKDPLFHCFLLKCDMYTAGIRHQACFTT